jgi:hypothetical protein
MTSTTELRFRDVPKFTRAASYACDVSWHFLPDHYARYVREYGLDVDPPFQRGYVWTQQQKIRYCEFILRGGATGRDLYLNCPGWNNTVTLGPRTGQLGYVCLVDGKQRLDAVLGFLADEMPVFGHLRSEYSDEPDIIDARFHWHVNDLQTWPEVLQWYIDLNAGGTVHSDEEIHRVREMIRLGEDLVVPSHEQIIERAGMHRSVVASAARKLEEAEAQRKAYVLAHANSPAKPARRRARRK